MRSRKPRSGIREVAQRAGLSVATVSRALNGVGVVRDETRRKVMTAAAELNYVPDQHARSLTTGRSRTIAAVLPKLTHPVFSAFLETLEKCLSGSGYSLVVASSDFDPQTEFERAYQMLKLGVDGLILSGEEHSSDLVRLVDEHDVPAVTISTFNPKAPLPTIGYDNRQLAHTAARYLDDLGHKKIAVVHGDTSKNDRTRGRVEALNSALADGDLSFWEVDWSERGGVEAARQVLSLNTQPTAFLCLSDVQALGVMFELQRAGKIIPDDYSVMGFDGMDWSELTAPALTTINLPVRRMAVATAHAMVKNLEDGIPIAAEHLPGELIERLSTRRL